MATGFPLVFLFGWGTAPPKRVLLKKNIHKGRGDTLLLHDFLSQKNGLNRFTLVYFFHLT